MTRVLVETDHRALMPATCVELTLEAVPPLPAEGVDWLVDDNWSPGPVHDLVLLAGDAKWRVAGDTGRVKGYVHFCEGRWDAVYFGPDMAERLTA